MSRLSDSLPLRRPPPVTFLAAMALAFISRNVLADEPAPDEAFLLFIANLEQHDKQWISPLDFDDNETPQTEASEPDAREETDDD